MVTFVYRNTFIAESSLPSLPRSRSCPSFGTDNVEEPAAVYVAELQQKSQDLRFQVRPQAEEEDTVGEMPVDVPTPDQQEVQQPVRDAPSSLGSRGHPQLCRRPCIRFNKGNCDMGDECGYCHFGEHRTFKSLDKRGRQKVQEMELGQLLHVLLPHIRRSLQLIQHDGVPGILVMLEEMAHNHRPHGNRSFDRELDRTLRQMPLSALLAFITCRSGPLQSVFQQLAESLRLSLP
mmetsp:Transcript_123743/g.174415  ORF Transcript_123743/g.174415 Transcript_123743/m.174415 type:complete len:234 (+) Transcript_123743:7-708(+)